MKKYQKFVEFSVRNWESTSFVDALLEIKNSQKEYENDYVEVQSINFLREVNNEHHYLIVFNLSRDLNDLGKKLDYY